MPGQTTGGLWNEGLWIPENSVPNFSFLEGLVDRDENGYILQKEGTMTNVDGIFAAGDVADHVYRQAITAAGQGCAAALECERWFTAKGVH